MDAAIGALQVIAPLSNAYQSMQLKYPPVLPPFMPATQGPDQASMLGTRKRGAVITFPPGVEDLAAWGCTTLELGSMLERRLPMRTWLALIPRSTRAMSSDVSPKLMHQKVSPVIPGTTDVRRLRRQ